MSVPIWQYATPDDALVLLRTAALTGQKAALLKVGQPNGPRLKDVMQQCNLRLITLHTYGRPGRVIFAEN